MTNRYPSRKHITALLVVLILAFAPQVSGSKIQLTEGTEVKLEFDRNLDISSDKYEQGQTIPVKLAQPIVVGGLVVVESGALGNAEVTVCEKAGRPGKPGKLKLSFIDLETKGSYSLIEKEAIALEGKTAEITGNGRKFLSYLLGFGFFIKGGNAKLATDTAFTATVAETVMLISE